MHSPVTSASHALPSRGRTEALEWEGAQAEEEAKGGVEGVSGTQESITLSLGHGRWEREEGK